MKLFYRFFLKGAICILIIFSGYLLNAQSQVRGTVTDTESQTPIPGANVTVKGTTMGTTTDAAGQYQLLLRNPDDVLLFSFIGYVTKEEVVGNRNVIDVNLDPDIKQLKEIVVVGYGTQEKSSVTGAVGSIKGEAINNLASANITQALQGRTAGVRVEVNGGSPGASANVIIRGTGSLTNVDPLYVIDGAFSQSMSFLNPADIESIEILKDASAAAIYGARAGQGVIIITTKTGNINQPLRIDINSSYGWQKAVRQIGYMNAAEYADYRNQANDNDGVPRAAANDSQFDPSIDSDIQSLSLRTAPVQNHGIRLYGGGQNSTYSISANYLKQEGIVVSSGFERSTFRVNTSQVLKKLKIDESLILSRSNNNQNTVLERNSAISQQP
jgi:TonB-linked SusC/RagA family outer membrane protein